MTDTNRKLERDGLENRVEGTVEELKGRARNAAGGVTGDTSEQLKGKGEELKGKAQQGIGRAQKELSDRLKDEPNDRPRDGKPTR